MKTLQEYMSGKIPHYKKNGAAHMVSTIEEMLEDGVDDLETAVAYKDEAICERNRHPSFSVKYQYYWSVHTYMSDLVEGYQRILNGNS